MGYRLAYAAGEFCQPIQCVCCPHPSNIEWVCAEDAYATSQAAITSTNELLARVLQS